MGHTASRTRHHLPLHSHEARKRTNVKVAAVFCDGMSMLESEGHLLTYSMVQSPS